jgi:hypothetical protein
MVRCSVVDVATGYGLDDPGIGVQVSVGSIIVISVITDHEIFQNENYQGCFIAAI